LLIAAIMRSVVALSVAAVAQAAKFGVETVHDGAAPVLSSVSAEAIPDSYIIKFKDHVDDSSASDHHSWVQNIHGDDDQQRLELRKRSSASEEIFAGLKHTFKIGDAFKGYAGHFHESVIEQVRNHPDVEFVERDSIVHTMLPVESESMVTEDKCDPETEKQAPWGLARVSHRDTLGFGTFNKYLYTAEGGEGVDAYVIDTGINTEHVDFEGRAKWGKTIPNGDADEDGNGHGTHCSGTVAGKKYGVAKKAHVYAVKVLRSNGSGTMSDVVKGVEYAAEKHIEQVKAAKDGKRKGFKGSVANMSLGGGKTQVLDAAVNAAVRSGIHFAVAAGNDNADACKYSPAAAEEPVTVGASALDDSRAYFSNYGKCTDIFAPGLSIQSTWIGSKYAVNTISGTSMASPHIAGLLAYYLSLQPAIDSDYATASITPKEMKKNVISIATKGTLSDIPADTPNLLAWNGGGCSNFSKIIEAGGYEATRTRTPSTIEELEIAIEEDFEVISGKVTKGAKVLGNKADKFAKKIHNLVDEEIKEFLSEISV
jgi:cerevisin